MLIGLIDYAPGGVGYEASMVPTHKYDVYGRFFFKVGHEDKLLSDDPQMCGTPNCPAPLNARNVP